MAVKHITDADFAEEIKDDRLVIVDFWAEWCAPCHMIAPTIEEISNTYADRVKVCKMNVDENPVTPSQFGIMGIPTVIFFKNGEEVDRIVGAAPKHTFIQKVEQHL